MFCGRDSRRLAGFRRHLAGGLFPGLCCGLSRFGRGFSQEWQFQLGLFRSAMVAMVQPLDARSFCFHPQLTVAVFLALVFQVCRNRFRCHSQSMAEPATSKLSTLALYQWSAIKWIGGIEALANVLRLRTLTLIRIGRFKTK